MFNSFNEMMEEIFKKDKKIADLEAKLAEKETDIIALDTENYSFKQQIYSLRQQIAEKDQAIESVQEINQSLGQTCNNDAKEIERLIEQLSEKEKEIEKYRNANIIVLGERIQGKKHLMQIKIKELQNQTAIAELEKLKKEINLRPVVVRKCGYGDVEEILLEDGYDVINQQIKSLEGEK